jgi:hypothetical protein
MIFLAFIVGMGWCTFYSFNNGNIKKLTAPMNGDHDFCGFGSRKGYPKLYITNFATTNVMTIMKSGVCVKECPKKAKVKMACALKKGKCPTSKYPTKDWYDFCLPADLSKTKGY